MREKTFGEILRRNKVFSGNEAPEEFCEVEYDKVDVFRNVVPAVAYFWKEVDAHSEKYPIIEANSIAAINTELIKHKGKEATVSIALLEAALYLLEKRQRQSEKRDEELAKDEKDAREWHGDYGIFSNMRNILLAKHKELSLELDQLQRNKDFHEWLAKKLNYIRKRQLVTKADAQEATAQLEDILGAGKAFMLGVPKKEDCGVLLWFLGRCIVREQKRLLHVLGEYLKDPSKGKKALIAHERELEIYRQYVILVEGQLREIRSLKK